MRPAASNISSIPMNNIQDLYLKKDLIPLFDYVCSDRSRDSLEHLFSVFPSTLPETLQRQDILKTLLRNDKLLQPFTYTRSEYNEVSGFIETLYGRNTYEIPAAIRLRLLFKRTARHRERGQITLLFMFLHKIDRAWFSHLRPEDYPEEFSIVLHHIIDMIRDLGVSRYQAIPRRRAYKLSEVTLLLGRLYEKINSGEMDNFWKSFHVFEAWLSIAKGIQKHRFQFPIFTDREMTIQDFYHPLLRQPVKNSISVRANVVLITGPNMSGKSTLLKSIGICVVLASLGLAVPAAGCRLPLFDSISVAIDLQDDMRSGYSHFMKEVITLKNIVTAAAGSNKCFAIFDELFRGTNNEDALAISRTTINGLTRFPGSVFFISTHLHQLKDSFHADRIATHYIECLQDKGDPVFTYRLLDGWSDLKIGQILFEREGLNALLSSPVR